jgi:hypothetical protein
MKVNRDRRTTVAVQPGAAMTSRPRLFAALEAAFPVSFTAAPGGLDTAGEIGAEAVVAICDGGAFPSHADLAQAQLPILAVGAEPRPGAAPAEALLADCDSVDRRLRGVSLLDPLDGPDPGSPEGAQEVLASVRSSPAWLRSRGPVPIDRVGSTLPELEPAQALRDLLAVRPLATVALIQFLRAVTAADSFRAPKQRAVILFDDPNLRWRSYGYIDYRQLLEHADAHGYHAAMAMSRTTPRRSPSPPRRCGARRASNRVMACAWTG